jgi:hypothetical protein
MAGYAGQPREGAASAVTNGDPRSTPYHELVPAMSNPPPLSYTVSCLHPDTRNFHAESCTTLEEAQQRVKELRAAGYQSVTISPPDRNTPSWPKT